MYAEPRDARTRQPHVLIAWELGGGLGHITRIAALARGLVAGGYRVSLCLQDLSRVFEFVAHLPLALFQAPIWQPRLRTAQQPVCFSDILLHRGYGSVAGLSSLVLSWRSLFESLRPDLLMFDYAPTALLAARSRQLPRILLSSGFGELTPGQADVCLRPWQAGGEDLVRASEQRVVAVVNRMLANSGGPPLHRLSDIYQADRLFLFTLPQIDFLPRPGSATYLAPPEECGRMPVAVWPAGEGAKVFAYLKPSSSQCLATIRALARLSCVGLVVCPGIPSRDVQLLQRPGLCIETRPRDVTRAIEAADAVVCHGGKTTISEALLAGKPLLLLPEQLEQYHNALRVTQLGAGLLVRRSDCQVRIQQALSQILFQPGYREASRAVAASNAELQGVDPVQAIADCCDILLAGERMI